MRRKYSIWLGCDASIWQHRGYRVVGERVEGVGSMRVARQIVRDSIGPFVSTTVPDGTYCYLSRVAMNRDDTGERAPAVISTMTDD